MAAIPTLDDEIRLGSRFVLRPRQAQLLDGGKRLPLGSRALDLLCVLAESPGELITKQHLIERVWPDTVVEENNLPVQIAALRKALGADAIATVPGRGYRLCLASARGGAAAGSIGHDRAPTLLGRGNDIDRVLKLVQTGRTVTLAGPGGVGKTTLARVVAREWCEATKEACAWADLAPIPDARLLVPTLATVLGIEMPADDASLATLAGLLKRRSSLLVIDNAEHLVDAVATAGVAFRQAGLGLPLLVTSREPLQIADERVYRLRGLDLPQPGAGLGEVLQSGAVALFLKCASDAIADFRPDALVVADIEAICARLDGLPLAIEMAAARVPSLGVAGLKVQLEQHWRMLSARGRSSAPRHETLEATLAWSHELLRPDEQRTLRRLAVSAAGFSLEAAQSVTCESGCDAWAVADALAALIDKSMVVADASDPPRYRLLETVRSYALQRLDASGERAQTRASLLRWCIEFFAAANESCWTRPSAAWAAEVVPELDNLRFALRDAAEDEAARGSVVALSAIALPIWHDLTPGGSAEARGLADAALSRVSAATGKLAEARLQFSRGMHYWSVDTRVALAAFRRSIALGAADRSDRDRAHVLLEFGRTLTRADELEAAEDALAQARVASRKAAIPKLSGLVSLASGFLCGFQKRWAEAREHDEDAVVQFERAQQDALAETARNDLADHLWAAGNLKDAEALLRRIVSEPKRQGSGIHDQTGVPQMNLASVLAESGNLAAALDWAREAIPALRRSDRMWSSYDALSLMAILRDDLPLAALLHGLSDSLYSRSGVNVREPNEGRIHASVACALRASLDERTLHRLVGRGAYLDQDTACELLLSAGQAVTPTSI